MAKWYVIMTKLPLVSSAGDKPNRGRLPGIWGKRGSPTFTHLIEDGHKILETVRDAFAETEPQPKPLGHGPVHGSVVALNLARHFPDKIKGDDH